MAEFITPPGQIPWFDDNPNAYQGPVDLWGSGFSQITSWNQVVISKVYSLMGPPAPVAGATINLEGSGSNSYAFTAKVTGSVGFKIDKVNQVNNARLTPQIKAKKYPTIRVRMYILDNNDLQRYNTMVGDIIGSQAMNLVTASTGTISVVNPVLFNVLHQGLIMYNISTLILEKATIPDGWDDGHPAWVEWDCVQYDPTQVGNPKLSLGAVNTGLPATAPTPPSADAGQLSPGGLA